MSEITTFDLEKLFLPEWVKKPASDNRFANHAGEASRPSRDQRDSRPPRRDAPRGFGPRPPGRGGPERPVGRGGPPNRGGRFDRPSFRDPRQDDRPEEPREQRPPLPDIAVTIVPDEPVVDSLVRQIRLAGRAFPLFEIAKMVLLKPDRYVVRFSINKSKEGTPIAPIFQCALDETIWFSENDAVAHVLNKHFGTFYQAERTATEPPKGVYTFVAQCGMSGVILGPPNHHDYQNQLRKLHTERFSRMPFEAFKARVKIVRDEAVVKKWIEDQSFRTEYAVLNVPEPLRLQTREDVEKHFREVHLSNIIKPVEAVTLDVNALRNQPCPMINRFLRWATDEQRRFPMAIATLLSQQFAQRGLQFFKVNKSITHVCVARPHYLDLETTVVADGVKLIVDYINTHPGCTRKKLIAALVPVPYKPIQVAPPTPASLAPAAESAPAPQNENGAPAGEVPAAQAAPVEPPKPPAPEPTPELQALNSDLHWLIHQGHVIEFHTGVLETAKKPLPKPVKPAPAPKAAAPETGAGQEEAATGEVVEMMTQEPAAVVEQSVSEPSSTTTEENSSDSPAPEMEAASETETSVEEATPQAPRA